MKNLLLDYCADGAYGPTIRIDIKDIAGLLKVRDVFLQLAEAKTYQVRFHEIEAVEMKGMKGLNLRLVPEGREHRRTLEIVGGSSMDPLFQWSRSSDGWRLCAELLESLIEDNAPGHQYLTTEGVDAAIVEVAYMEAPE